MNEDMVGRLFEQFKEQYGSTVAEPASVFDGQRDLQEFVMGIGRALEQRMFSELGSGYRGPSTEVEGVAYRFKGYRSREVQGLFGKVELRRAYYVAGEGRTYYPLDQMLPAWGDTPGLQYFLSLFTAQMPYEAALRRFHQIFRPDGRDKLSMRKALDMDYELGRRLGAVRQRELQQVLREDRPIDKEAPIEGTMVVCADATKVREKLGTRRTRGRRRRYEIGFKDAKVATVSEVHWDAKRREARCVNSSYVSAVEEADPFFDRIWVEMQRRGRDPENQMLAFICDGGNWIWPRVRDLSNARTIEILDFYHAAERLSDACKELYGEETPPYFQRFRRWKSLLLQGKTPRVIRELKRILGRTRPEETRKILRLLIGYFTDNLSRMDYPHYRRMKLPIGSGTVESACKNVIGGRMKLGGMTWSPNGADGMLQIRCSQESDRFESDFRALLAAA